MLSKPQTGCMETFADGSIPPEELAYILVPEHLKEHLNIETLTIKSGEIIFVPNKLEKVHYHGRGRFEIDCPDYDTYLEFIITKSGYERGMLTHMTRCNWL